MDAELRRLIHWMEKEIILTNPEKGLKGAIDKAEEIVSQMPDAYMFKQFDNPANTKIHFETTGPEIWEDTLGGVDIFIASIGTGGTITGTGHYLKMMNEDIKIIGVEPAETSVISGENPGYMPSILDVKLLDAVVKVKPHSSKGQHGVWPCLVFLKETYRLHWTGHVGRVVLTAPMSSLAVPASTLTPSPPMPPMFSTATTSRMATLI